MTEENYTKISNELLEAYARIQFSGNQQRILCVIARQTFGWHRDIAKITIKEFQAATGIDNSNINRTINQLQEKGFISKAGAWYEINLPNMWTKDVKIDEKTSSKMTRKAVKIDEISSGPIIIVKKEKNTPKEHASACLLFNRREIMDYFADYYADDPLRHPQHREMIISFINKARAANKTESLKKTRAHNILSSFDAIREQFSQAALIEGVRAVLNKEVFNYQQKDCTAYVKAVARTHHAKTSIQEHIKKEHIKNGLRDASLNDYNKRAEEEYFNPLA